MAFVDNRKTRAPRTLIEGVVANLQTDPVTRLGSMQIDSKWYEIARAAESKEMPAIGQRVRFWAYGDARDYFYRWEMPGTDISTVIDAPTTVLTPPTVTITPPPTIAPAAIAPAPVPAGANVTRVMALNAAARIYETSGCSAADVIAAAKAFEEYLTGVAPAPEPEIKRSRRGRALE